MLRIKRCVEITFSAVVTDTTRWLNVVPTFETRIELQCEMLEGFFTILFMFGATV